MAQGVTDNPALDDEFFGLVDLNAWDTMPTDFQIQDNCAFPTRDSRLSYPEDFSAVESLVDTSFSLPIQSQWNPDFSEEAQMTDLHNLARGISLFPSEDELGPIETERLEAEFVSLKPASLECSYCRQRFRRSEHLKRHVSTVHRKEKELECKVKGCGKFFDAQRRDNWRDHLRRHISRRNRKIDVTWAEKELQKEEEGRMKKKSLGSA